jgi:hypothetical protein
MLLYARSLLDRWKQYYVDVNNAVSIAHAQVNSGCGWIELSYPPIFLFSLVEANPPNFPAIR